MVARERRTVGAYEETISNLNDALSHHKVTDHAQVHSEGSDAKVDLCERNITKVHADETYQGRNVHSGRRVRQRPLGHNADCTSYDAYSVLVTKKALNKMSHQQCLGRT